MSHLEFKPLKGLIAAPFTPMHSDGSINYTAIERQAEHLVSSGVRGAFICGTTGEGLSLTVTERMQIAARWVEVIGKEMPVIVHSGHTCLADAKALASHAEMIGSYATAALAPCFFKPASVGALVDYCAELAAASPSLPFYFYHIPSMTGVSFSMTEFLHQAADRIPNLAGVKFTYENLMDFAQARQVEGGRFDLLFGRDEMLLNSLPLGTEGAVGSTYNYSAPIYLRILDAFRKWNMADARLHQNAANQFIATMVKFGGLPAGKAIMGLIGVDCGPVRLPLQTLSKSQIDELGAELQRGGFFESIGCR